MIRLRLSARLGSGLTLTLRQFRLRLMYRICGLALHRCVIFCARLVYTAYLLTLTLTLMLTPTLALTYTWPQPHP